MWFVLFAILQARNHRIPATPLNILYIQLQQTTGTHFDFVRAVLLYWRPPQSQGAHDNVIRERFCNCLLHPQHCANSALSFRSAPLSAWWGSISSSRVSRVNSLTIICLLCLSYSLTSYSWKGEMVNLWWMSWRLLTTTVKASHHISLRDRTAEKKYQRLTSEWINLLTICVIGIRRCTIFRAGKCITSRGIISRCSILLRAS
jgi:hypothetical protein